MIFNDDNDDDDCWWHFLTLVWIKLVYIQSYFHNWYSDKFGEKKWKLSCDFNVFEDAETVN